jgi:SynChlorMet cassette radical SAM/SPASM protein ScmF
MSPRCGYTLHNLYVYMSEECNLACRHCWQSARVSMRRLPTASVERLCAFVDEALPLGLRYVKISGGEPLIRAGDVLTLVEHTHKLSMVRTRLETNGTLIDDGIADALARCGVLVSVSMDGGTAEVHEGLRVVPGCFDASVAAIERLQKRGMSAELVFSLHGGNLEDFPNVVRLASRLGCSHVKVNPVLASGRGSVMQSRGQLLSISALQEFVRSVERDYTSTLPRVSVSTPPAFHSLNSISRGQASGGRCGFKSLLGVLADGRVSSCGVGYRAPQFVFMKAGEQALDAVWNDSPQLAELRSLVPDRLEGVCANCVARSSCQGACRAEAYEYFGSLTAPAPSCQQLYDAGLFPTQRLIRPDNTASYATSPREASPRVAPRVARAAVRPTPGAP